MQLKVLGSSSKGNCYLLDNGSEALAIECGIAFKEVQKAVGFDIARIKGAVVSHEHGDHAGYAESFLSARVPVYMSEGTLHSVAARFKSPCLLPLKMKAGHPFTIGRFKILPFDTKHDAAEPFGFLIDHPECGTVLFATDTYYLHNTFAGLNNILIECNYRQDILDENTRNGLVAKPQRDRTVKSHMEYETCKETLLANDLTKVNNIVLIHLSNNNSNADEFRKGIAKTTGKTVTVAHKGLVMDNFNVAPF